MPAMILDPQLQRELIAQRALTGADRYDEVWEGVTMLSPMANNQHLKSTKGDQVWQL
ncbi:MAG: hypothetical protein IT422_11770 [Pirellulaceae bacterium]|jgi:hypothetical protein|nr:hypothetical protein [Pirellulaceae bacterium]